MKLRTLFVTVLVSTQATIVLAEGAKPRPSPVPSSKPKLRPSSDDIANDVVKDTSSGNAANEKDIESSLREGGTVVVGGVRYLAFRHAYGTLLVPAVGEDLKREDINDALCAKEMKPGVHVEDSQMLVGATKQLSEQYAVYAGLMAKVIRDKCGVVRSVESPDFQPEAGVKWKNGSKTGGENKVFVNPRGVGAGSSF